MDETRMPGVALGIVKGDTILHLKGFGEADDSGRAVTAQTPFIIGSMSKSFTALAIMQLVEYAKLNYTVLGMIVQSVSGESYERYVKDHILIPLDMRDSYMFVPEAEQHGLATGHQYWF